MVKDEDPRLWRSAPSVFPSRFFFVRLAVSEYPWVSQQRYKQIKKS